MTDGPNFTDPDLYLGTVVSVGPSGVTVNLPFAAAASLRRVQGRRRLGGLVGDFVCIDAEGWVLVGRLDDVWLPERDRGAVDPRVRAERPSEPHPVGSIELLATLHIDSERAVPGAERPPKLGARVYLAPLEVVGLALGTDASGAGNAISLDLGTQPRAHDEPFRVTPEALFDRHCAVLGSTGGGKSWTTARLIEAVADAGGRVLLIDPTGEYRPPAAVTTSVRLGVSDVSTGLTADPVTFPYWLMTNEDLFALFTPAGQMQAPLLREAIISLRLVAAIADDPPGPAGIEQDEEGVIIKRLNPKRPVVDGIRLHRDYIEKTRGSFFQINLLVEQLKQECVWPSDFSSPANWGDRDLKSLGFILPLVMRIESFLNDSRYACVFGHAPGGYLVTDAVERFRSDPDKRILHLDISTVPLERNFKQVVGNALARYMLDEARAGTYKSQPLLVVLDEAHHFLGRISHLEEFGVALDSIELIAKEGRKYGLHLLLTTQRPRDLTQAVISQIGCTFAHRMNERGDLDVLGSIGGRRGAGTASYVPVLGPGECVVYGSSLPFPVLVHVRPPDSPPASSGSDFSGIWTR